MSVYALVIDDLQTLPDLRRRCEDPLKVHKLSLYSYSDADQAFQTLVSCKEEGIYALIIILGSGLEQPLQLARRLYNEAPLAHYFFFTKNSRPALQQQLQSPVVGFGKHWSLLNDAGDNWAADLQKAVHSARQRYQFRTTLHRVNRKLMQRPIPDNQATQRYSLSLRFLSNIFEYAHDAIIATTLDGTIVRWNKAAERMFGLTVSEAVGAPIAGIAGGEWNERVPDMIENLLNSEVSNREYGLACEQVGKAKLYIDLMLSIVQSQDGNPIGISAVVRDITEQKYNEEMLAQLRNELELLSFRDGLTNVANRRMFDQSLQHEWQRALRFQQPLTLIMIDIDFFKEYNDCYGHQRGDSCLIQVANALAAVSKRATDLIARYGGEEFVILLPETEIEKAVVFAHACHAAVLDLGIPHQLSKVSNVVTISAGVASITPTANCQAVDLVKSADKLLYQAKCAGRNQVISAAPAA